MERRRKLDVAGAAPCGAALIRYGALLFFVVGCSLTFLGQSLSADPQIEQIKTLFATGQWQAIVNLAEPIPNPTADVDFYYGTALARLQRWRDAERAFQAGERLQPRDPRFPVELAGVAFRQKQYGTAATHLRRALNLAPHDSYANDFLGTVYFLQGNLDAALKYWNRIGKPEIAAMSSEPNPALDPALLDHAFAFSPAAVMRLPDLWTTEARLQSLEIFPTAQVALQAREDGKFDAVFRNRELDGWGPNKWESLLLMLRGLPAQSVYPEYFNLKGRALNFSSMLRWDAQKRRLRANFSGPIEGNPGRRFSVGADLRNEDWALRQSFTGPAPLLGALNLRREAANVAFTDTVNGRWGWSAGAEFSHRDFRSVLPGTALTPALLINGFQLKQVAGMNAVLWRSPERRLTLSADVSSQAGRIWSGPSHSFEKLQSSLRWHWFPQAQGDDYEMQHQIRAGKTWGSAPFDELFALGIDADNDLWMRGHIATRDGKKGSAPMGRSYFLSDWEMDKNVYRNALLTLKLGPFVDTGKILDAVPLVGPREWLWDAGVQAKARMLGAEVVLSYGKDLRSGSNAVYLRLH